MAISSINTNIAAQFAQQNISVASSQSQSSVARLSSGNRIVQASDDVAALSIGTSLKSQVAALNTALLNSSQATSLLQVADGALAQIQNILQQQKSIALQAGSGSLTDTDRGFLNQQFQALSAQIDNLTASTSFNGVGLLDGTTSSTIIATNADTKATEGTVTISFTDIDDAETVIINGVTLTAETGTVDAAGEFQSNDTDVVQSVANLAAYLNNAQNDTTSAALSAANKLLVSGATYTAVGANLIITSRPGGDNVSFVAEDATASGATAAYTVLGNGSNSVSSVSGINATSLDTSAVTTAEDKFDAGVITFDGTTIYTTVIGDTLREIVANINENTDTHGVTAYVTGSTGAYRLNLRTQSDTTLGVVAGAAVTGATGLTANTLDVTDGAEVITGGLNDGLGLGSVTATGSTGGDTSILTDQSQTAAEGGYNFNPVAPGNLVTNLESETIVVGGVTFTFTQTSQASGSLNEIEIGATLEETLDNAVAKINAYTGDSDTNYIYNQFTASRDGTRLLLTANVPGGVLDVAGTAATFTIGTSADDASVFSTFAAPTNTGVTTNGISNKDFIGTIGGVTATYSSNDTVDLSVTVGDHTYLAQGIDTSPTSDTTVRFVSDNGGYFDIQLRNSFGETVTNQAGADVFAQRINNALSGLTFSQNRILDSYDAGGTGSLSGSSFELQGTVFSDTIAVNTIDVTAPSGSSTNATISITVNDEVYTNSVDLGGQIGANAVIKFISASDPNKILTFRNGGTDLDLSTAAAAQTVEDNLKSAFGASSDAAALNFQVGTTSASTIKVAIDDVQTNSLFAGVSLSVATASDAAIAAAAVDVALNTLSGVRAGVGALQTQFGFASAALQSSVQNQDAARALFLDTDIASESTSFATSQVKLQAGISVLAQANQQLQALLKLIG